MNRLPVFVAFVLGLALAGCTVGTLPIPEVGPLPPAVNVTIEPATPAVPTATPLPPSPAPTATPTEPPEPTPTPAWACAPEPARLTIWHDWPEPLIPNIQALLDAYASACPGNSVALVARSDMSEAAFASDEQQPDIIVWWNREIGGLVAGRVIAALNDYIDVEGFNGSFSSPAVAAVTYTGNIYAYPESVSTIALIYNKDLIREDELPASTDQWLRVAADWKKTDFYVVYSAQNDVYFSAPWWHAAGVTMIDEAGTVSYATEGGYAVASFLVALKRVMPPEIDYVNASALFLEGRAAAIVNGTWYAADLDAAGINYGVRELPVFSPTNKAGAPFVEARSLMLTRHAVSSGTAPAAVNLMQFYTSAAAQVWLAEQEGLTPSNLTALADRRVLALPAVAAFGRQAAAGRALPGTPLFGAIIDPVAQGLECIWTAAAPPEQCVDNIQASAEGNVAVMQ